MTPRMVPLGHDTAKSTPGNAGGAVNLVDQIRGGFLGRPCFGDENNGGLNQVVLNLQ